METVFATLVAILGLICWGGQTLVLFAPDLAVKLGVNEPEDSVDRSMYLFERYSQGIMDCLLCWLLPASAMMMLLDYKHWPIVALVGAGVYLYFPGVFCITRILFRRNGLKVGSPTSQITAFVFGALWVSSAVYMIARASVELGLAA